jgi:hypothetical protein
MLNSPGLTSTSWRCRARLGRACRPEKRVEPVEVLDMVEDLVKRGRESKEVARLIRRNPPGVVWVSSLEPWLVAVVLLLLVSLFCARRERRDDKSRALMVCVESVIGEDVFVLSIEELVELVL